MLKLIHGFRKCRKGDLNCSSKAGSLYRQLFTLRLCLLHQGTVHIATALADNTSSVDTLSQMKFWLAQCQGSSHQRCSTAQRPTWVPKRLIRIGRTQTDRILLVETANLCKPVEKYITLSHCWGDPQISPLSLRLTVEDEAPFGDPAVGVVWEKLPKNFQHAIEVARELDVQYVWIDALCIIQDNDEFHHEGQLMHLVYRHAFCTLAVAGSEDSQGGLFRVRSANRLIPKVFNTSRASRFGNRAWILLPRDFWHDQLLEQPLYKRGWVFQGIASPQNTNLL